MANRNDERTSDADRVKKSSSGETSGNRHGKLTSADKEELGRQRAAESGTTTLGDEGAESGNPGAGGVEGTGGPA